MIYPKSIATLIEQFQKFPSVGPKSAQRMAFQVLKMPLSEVEKFANAIIMAKRTSKTCEICYNISTQSPCEICSSNARNKSVICVVAETKDLIAIEKTNEYKGLYHVLHGVFDPIRSKSLEDTTIAQLIDRLGKHPEIKEVIVATNQTAEGNATALFLSRMLKPSGIKVSRIASGLPMGSDIEYADDLTLASALTGRVTLTDET